MGGLSGYWQQPTRQSTPPHPMLVEGRALAGGGCRYSYHYICACLPDRETEHDVHKYVYVVIHTKLLMSPRTIKYWHGITHQNNRV